jgi:hypothetical protein
MAQLGKLAPIVLTVLIAGFAGFTAGRARTGLEARVAASSAIKAGADGCGKLGSKEIAFTGRRDLAEVRIEGPDCGRALVLWTVRNGDKELVLSGAEPYGAWDLTLERGKPPAAGMPEAIINSILNQMEVRNSDWLPAWPNGQASLHGADDPGYSSTPLTRGDYEALRAAKRPILCYGVAHEAGACAVWDKDNAGAYVVFESGV